jgi:hypothetical protein
MDGNAVSWRCVTDDYGCRAARAAYLFDEPVLAVPARAFVLAAVLASLFIPSLVTHCRMKCGSISTPMMSTRTSSSRAPVCITKGQHTLYNWRGSSRWHTGIAIHCIHLHADATHQAVDCVL